MTEPRLNEPRDASVVIKTEFSLHLYIKYDRDPDLIPPPRSLRRPGVLSPMSADYSVTCQRMRRAGMRWSENLHLKKLQKSLNINVGGTLNRRYIDSSSNDIFLLNALSSLFHVKYETA